MSAIQALIFSYTYTYTFVSVYPDYQYIQHTLHAIEISQQLLHYYIACWNFSGHKKSYNSARHI